ncbi:hypothetical protein ACRRTK_010503 [Alexandromys fortis]
MEKKEKQSDMPSGLTLTPQRRCDVGKCLALVHVSARYFFLFWLPGSLPFILDKRQDWI